MVRFLQLIMLISVSFQALSQPLKPSVANNRKQLVIQNTPQSNTSEIDAYKLLYQVSKDAADSQRSALYTILSIVTAFIIFVLGSQIYFNWRMNEQEVASLKDLFEQKLSENLVENNKNQELVRKSLSDEFQLKVNELEKRQSDSLNKLQESNEKYTKLLGEKLELQISKANADIMQNKADVFYSNANYDAALDAYLDACEQKLEVGLKPSLTGVSKTLRRLEEIFESDAERVRNVVSMAKEKFPEKNRFLEIGDRILAHLDKMSGLGLTSN